MSKSLTRTLAAIAVLLVVGLAAPARAHEGSGILTVEAQDPTPDGVQLVVRLVWENDGHPAVDATLTATPIDPAGVPGTPVPLSAIDEDGRYGAEVPLSEPGSWTVRLTAVSPAATIEFPQVVVPAATTTSSSTLGPTTTSTEASDAAPSDEADSDDSGSSSTTTVILLAAILVVALAAIAGYRRSNRRLADRT